MGRKPEASVPQTSIELDLRLKRWMLENLTRYGSRKNMICAAVLAFARARPEERAAMVDAWANFEKQPRDGIEPPALRPR